MNRRGRRVLVYCAGAVLLTYAGFAAWTLVHAARSGWVGIRIYNTQQDYATISIVPGGPTARQTQIPDGQQVLALDGRKPASQWLRHVSEALRPGNHVTLTLANRHGARDVAIRAESPLRTPLLATRAIEGIAVALAFWLVGFWFYRRDRQSDASALFFLYSQLTAVLFLVQASIPRFITGMEGFTYLSTVQKIGLVYVLRICTILTMILLFHFALAFPKDRPSLRQRHVLVWVYGLGVLPYILEQIDFPLMNAAWTARRWVILCCVMLAGVVVATGLKRGWRTLVRRPILPLLLLLGVGALLIVYSGTTASGTWPIAILKGIPEFPDVMRWIFWIGTCVALLAGLWQVERTQRRTSAMAVGGIVLAVAASYLFTRIPIPTLGAFGMSPREFHWFLANSGIPFDSASLFIPLGVAAMLLMRRQTMTA